MFLVTAGGLATYLHADFVRSKIPSNTPVHAIADAGSVPSHTTYHEGFKAKNFGSFLYLDPWHFFCEKNLNYPTRDLQRRQSLLKQGVKSSIT